MLNRSVPPQIVDATDFNLHLKPYEYFTLDNGIPVYALRAPEQEVTFVEWVFFAGNAYEKNNMTATAANYLLKNGTRTKTAFAINEYLYGFTHPYGRYASASDYDNLERNKLIGFYDNYYINGKCILFIAGN